MKRRMSRKPICLVLLRCLAVAAAALSLATCIDAPPDTKSMLEQYPLDQEGDDRPGLIVTGLGAEGVQDEASSFLLSVSMFRLNQQTPGSGDGYAHLVTYDEPLLASSHLGFYEAPIDNCLLRGFDDVALNASYAADASVSGGAGVVINTPGGPWFTFDRQSGDTARFFYQVDNMLPGQLPANATLSVPGDEFPTVAAYALFEPDPPVRLLPLEEQSVTSDSEYTWVPGPAGGHIKINLLAYDETDNFIGFPVTCWVEDDGLFEMPIPVIDFVLRSDITLKARYSRVYARLDWTNGVVMHQNIEVAE